MRLSFALLFVAGILGLGPAAWAEAISGSRQGAPALSVTQAVHPSVLVWDLGHPAGETSTAQTIEQRLAEDMTKNPHLQVLTRSDLKQSVEFAAQAQKLGAGNKGLAKLAQRASADFLVTGLLKRSKRGWVLSMQLLDTSSVHVVDRRHISSRSQQELLDKLSPLALRFAARVAGLPAQNISGAARDLFAGLIRSGAPSSAGYTVSPLNYDQTPFSSAFGQRMAKQLSQVQRASSNKKKTLHVSGAYRVHADRIEITLHVDEHPKWRSHTSLLLAAGKSADPLVPANIDRANSDLGELSDWHSKGPGLDIDLWTARGRHGLVYFDDEPIELFLSANKPAWIRLIYHLASGERVLLEDHFEIDQAQINKPVAYPGTLTVAPPHGVEFIQAVGFAQRPAPLATQTVAIQGTRYQVIPDLASAVLHRGFKKQIQNHAIDEALVYLTTAAK